MAADDILSVEEKILLLLNTLAPSGGSVVATGASTPTDAFTNPTTAVEEQSFLMGYNGAKWDRLRSSLLYGLQIDDTRLAQSEDVFGQVVTTSRIPQIIVPFFQVAPSAFLTVTASGGGAAAQGTGLGTFSTGTAATAECKAVSPGVVGYTAHCEIYAAFTAGFTTPTSSGSYQRIGLYNATDGWSFGYSGTTFGIWLRYNGADTFIAQSTWNGDVLSGAAGSRFTSAGTPVALNPAQLNVYRIRAGWLGIAGIMFEVDSPDGVFVAVHTFRPTNTQNTPSVTNPNMPMTVDVSKTSSDSTNLVVSSGCWVAGIAAGETPFLFGAGSLTGTSQIVIPLSGAAGLAVQITGSWTGQLAFSYSIDGINWNLDKAINTTSLQSATYVTVNGAYCVACSDYRYYKISTQVPVTGTANITYSTGAVSNKALNLSVITDANNNGPAAVMPGGTSPTSAGTAAAAVVLRPDSAVSSSVIDQYPASQSITAQDTASTSTTGANSQSLVTGTPTAGSVAVFAVGATAYDTATIQASGSWTGALMIEVSRDNGATYIARLLHQSASAQPNSSFTANFVGCVSIAGYTHVRVRATAAWTGTATIGVNLSLNPFMVFNVGNANQGAAGSQSAPWWTRITDGTNSQPTMDVAARAGYMQVTDGTNIISVKAAQAIASSADKTIPVQVTNGGGNCVVLPTVLTGSDGVISQSGSTSTFSSATMDTTNMYVGMQVAIVDGTHTANSGTQTIVTIVSKTSFTYTNASGASTASSVGWTLQAFVIATACASGRFFAPGTRSAAATVTATVMSQSGVPINVTQSDGASGRTETMPGVALVKWLAGWTQINLQNMTTNGCDLVVEV